MQFELRSTGTSAPHFLTDPIQRLVQQQSQQQKVSQGLCFIHLPGSGATLFSINCPEGNQEAATQVIESALSIHKDPAFLSVLLGTQLHFPIVRGQLQKETWQEIVLVDFELSPRWHQIKVRVISA